LATTEIDRSHVSEQFERKTYPLCFLCGSIRLERKHQALHRPPSE
jgi:hypothetical protein